MAGPADPALTRVALVLGPLLFLVFAALHYRFGFYFWGQDSFSVGNDDAFISYRYARNLVEHGILSFNPGDSPPVEGFSNPLHVALASGVLLLFPPAQLYPVMALLGALGALAALLVVHRLMRQALGDRTAAFGLLTLCLVPPIWVHATSGLETPFVLLMQVLIWQQALALARDDAPAPLLPILVVSVLLVWTRTDGFLFPLFAALWLMLRGRLRAGLAIIVTAVAAFFLLMALRLGYFGLPMPLTYYAKVSGDLGARLMTAARLYASICLRNGLLLPLLGAVALALLSLWRLARGRVPFRRAIPFEVWAFALLSLYYLYVGGDIYRDRFLIVLYPLGLVAALRFFHETGLRQGAVVFCAAAVLTQLPTPFVDKRFDFVFDSPKYDRAVTLGTYLHDTYPGALLATSTAGKPPFFSGLETIDILGLNDRHIAMSEARSTTPGHNKWDTDYLLGRSPDLICSHVFGSGDLPYGLPRNVYEPAGYRLVLLVRNRAAEGAPIVPVAGMTPDAVAGLIAGGYSYACVERQEGTGQ